MASLSQSQKSSIGSSFFEYNIEKALFVAHQVEEESSSIISNDKSNSIEVSNKSNVKFVVKLIKKINFFMKSFF